MAVKSQEELGKASLDRLLALAAADGREKADPVGGMELDREVMDRSAVDGHEVNRICGDSQLLQKRSDVRVLGKIDRHGLRDPRSFDEAGECGKEANLNPHVCASLVDALASARSSTSESRFPDAEADACLGA